MEIIRAKNYDEMSAAAAKLITDLVNAKNDCVLGLATGSTPIATYKHIISAYENKEVDFSKVTSINLDEYKGLSPESDQSYRYFMNTNLFDHININKAKTYIPNGLEPDGEKACKDYDEVIKNTGGVDLQVLGLGNNGHIGFNEPDEYFPKTTHMVDLASSTIEANSRFFDTIDDVPKQAYTMGIQTIMNAKQIVVLVSGKGKAKIVKEAFYGPITPKVPASILQLHNNVVLIGDEEALSEI